MVAGKYGRCPLTAAGNRPLNRLPGRRPRPGCSPKPGRVPGGTAIRTVLQEIMSAIRPSKGGRSKERGEISLFRVSPTCNTSPPPRPPNNGSLLFINATRSRESSRRSRDTHGPPRRGVDRSIAPIVWLALFVDRVGDVLSALAQGRAGPRHRCCAALSLLFLSRSQSGCLSFVVGARVEEERTNNGDAMIVSDAFLFALPPSSGLAMSSLSL